METIEIHEGDNGVSFFSLKIDGREVGRMMVDITPGILRAGHTGVGLTQRRNGYGRKLVNAVVDYARKSNLKIIPECGFVAMLFKKYPDLYRDVRARE